MRIITPPSIRHILAMAEAIMPRWAAMFAGSSNESGSQPSALAVATRAS